MVLFLIDFKDERFLVGLLGLFLSGLAARAWGRRRDWKWNAFLEPSALGFCGLQVYLRDKDMLLATCSCLRELIVLTWLRDVLGCRSSGTLRGLGLLSSNLLRRNGSMFKGKNFMPERPCWFPWSTAIKLMLENSANYAFPEVFLIQSG